MKKVPIKIIDLFAGPGGLGEGFSSLYDKDGNPVFEIALSIEKDEYAHRTLRLRSFARKIFKDSRYPRKYLQYIANPTSEMFESLIDDYPAEWEAASLEACNAELKVDDYSMIEHAKERLVGYSGPLVLIGGPPCQAYSVVGRSRRAHDASLATDEKQTLYKCYLSFIKALKPDVFVMENVKGMLSAQYESKRVFDLIKSDMQDAGYTIRSLVQDNPVTGKDFVIEAEKYGVPQARHRVILLGIKKDSSLPDKLRLLRERVNPSTVYDAIGSLPALRSGFSKRSKDLSDEDWSEYIQAAACQILESNEGSGLKSALDAVFDARCLPKRSSCNLFPHSVDPEQSILDKWYRAKLEGKRVLPNHETRSHLALDLDRYLFCAAYARAYGVPARLWHMPDYLIPNHANAKNAKTEQNKNKLKFTDRFRVQLYDSPSTTITSHIAKDGHYYIHPDVKQCRALTVREAARLQTFPDDYYFEGGRTQQYQQIGNAVPPLLAQQIASVVADIFGIDNKSFFEINDDASSEVCKGS